jgi:hypothetical protein
MTDPTARDEGYDDLLDAVAAGEGTYLECSSGHGSLPPRRVCPVCGERDPAETPLPATGTVVTFTVVHVPTPQFAGEEPYVTAIAEFGPVRLTGLLVGVDPAAVETGTTVAPGVRETDDGRRLIFEPATD